ncbi:hypothetical protein conserved [Leishmania donovani]|nr:hypothetical protein conserved [Leishmania donovani]VDZ43555.1 hypothetical_protein_conserved [Leishmania donovani]
MRTMAQSSLYPSQHRTLRVLELACPGSDADVRENCAYLVSKRRMTIDEAIEYVKGEVEKGKSTAATAITTTTPSLERATTMSATRSAVAAPVAASAASSCSPSRSYLPPPSCPRPRACECEGSDAGADNAGTTYYQGYQSAHTRPSTTTEGTTTATRAVPVSARPTAAPPLTADAPHKNRTPARSTTRRQYTQGASAVTVTPPVDETSPQTLMKGQSEHRVSDGTTDGVTGSGVAASRPRSRGRLDQKDGELHDLREASAPMAEGQLNESSTCGVFAPTTARKSPESAAAALTARAPPASKPGRDAYNADAATVAATPPSTATLLQRRPLPPCPSAVPSLAYTGCREGAADDGAPRKAAERGDTDEGYCVAEPRLSELKQTTEEERAAFESQQADMMYYWYRDETSMFDDCLSRYGPGQVLLFMTSMTGERAVRDRCRLMENLLFIKLIPHHTIDIADSEFFHRRVRRLYTSATNKHNMPEMPLLFVDTKLIGDFVTVQELEDCGELDAKMIEAGCRVLRQRIVDAYQRQRAGLAAVPLLLPVNKRSAAKSTEPGKPSSTAPVGASRPNVTLDRCAVTSGGQL